MNVRLSLALIVLVPLSTFLEPLQRLSSCNAADSPTVKLPPTATAKAGRLIRLQADTACSAVKWILSDPDNADLIPIASEKAAIFSGQLLPGQTSAVFRVWVFTGNADGLSEPVLCLITVGSPTPIPVPPPQPPNPPPTPTDDLAQALAAAWLQEADQTRSSNVQLLAALWRRASLGDAYDPSITDTAALLTVLQKAGKAMLGDPAVPGAKLVGLRSIIAGYLDKTFAVPKPLDAASRKQLSDTFGHIADALSTLR